MAIPTLFLTDPGTAGVSSARPLCPGQPAAGRLAKRAFDVVGALVLLSPAAPLLAVLAVVMRARCGYPVLFRQHRVTRAGRTAVRSSSCARSASTATLTRAGRCRSSASPPSGSGLRSTHLDELPQLVNVLRGDMSLVGPRPERPYFATASAVRSRRYSDRHRMRAGLTGWAQVNGLTGDTSISDRVRFDNFYIEYWSLWLDLLILARTGLGGAVRSTDQGRHPMKVLHVITGLGVGGAELQLRACSSRPGTTRRRHALQPRPGRGHDPRRRRRGPRLWTWRATASCRRCSGSGG